MSDLISRQAAIDLWVWGDTDKWRDSKVVHIEDIEALPSARKKGKWRRRIVDSGFNSDWVCSKCGYRWQYDYINFNFCPNCGADMRGEEDG